MDKKEAAAAVQRDWKNFYSIPEELKHDKDVQKILRKLFCPQEFIEKFGHCTIRYEKEDLVPLLSENGIAYIAGQLMRKDYFFNGHDGITLYDSLVSIGLKDFYTLSTSQNTVSYAEFDEILQELTRREIEKYPEREAVCKSSYQALSDYLKNRESCKKEMG